jgi:hypothetical protein
LERFPTEHAQGVARGKCGRSNDISRTVPSMVELLVVDAVGSSDLPVQMGCPRPDGHVTDVELLEMPVEVGLKFGAIVGLNHLDAEG